MPGDLQIYDLAWLDGRPEQHLGELLGMAGIVRFDQDAARRTNFVFKMPRQEFEQIWSTLKAPGVEKRLVEGSHNDLTNEYIFRQGNQSYAVKKASSAPAISALASRLRNHADAAMKSGAMTAVPLGHRDLKSALSTRYRI